MNRAEPIRDADMLRAFLDHYKSIGHHRNYLLVNMGVHTALRISDMLKLCAGDVYDFTKKRIRSCITLTEKKTGKTKTVALHKNVKEAMHSYFGSASPKTPLFANEITGLPISRSQAHRIIAEAAEAACIPHRVSSHSLRKTFGYHAWRDGTSPVLLMDIYNHSSYEVTKRYLGVTQDDHNKVYLNLPV